MRDPFKLVVWGPGGLGAACIYEIAQRADLQLVGVRGYDPAKDGLDAGTLIGIAPLGVAISADAKKVAQIECDAIIYTPRDLGNYNNDDEILWLLRSGRNIITALPYQHVKLTREPEFVAKLEQACLEGGSVFHATGVDPDIISDRVLAGLSGFCNDIQSIRLQENWDQAYGPADTLMLCGFCKTVEEAQAMPIAAGIADNFLRTVCYGVGHTFKVSYDRVESSHEYVLTDQDIQLTHITVPAGTVGRVTHRCAGWIAGREKPFFEIEVNWHCGDGMLPPGTAPNQYWIVSIEGRPSVKAVVDLKASVTSGGRFIAIGDRNSEPGYHAVIAACLQIVPLVTKSKPGILAATLPPVHWLPDMRAA